MRDAALHEALPIVIVGVGTVSVSGLPQAADHAFVVAQLRAFLSHADTERNLGSRLPR